MSPITHFLTGWVLANSACTSRRGRALVTMAAVVPDIDGLGAIPDWLTRNSQRPTEWFATYHHSLHNLGFALLVAAVALVLARGGERQKVGLLAFLGVNVHFFEDLIGSRGRDGFQWPIRYLMPFSHLPELTWSGQWALNAWPNYVITLVFLFVTFYWAWAKGFSPLELLSERADGAFVGALRNRFPK